MSDKIDLNSALNLVALLTRQASFSAKAFGPGRRTAGLVAHIGTEFAEIAETEARLLTAEGAGDNGAAQKAAQDQLAEWVDVVLLSLDGCLRTGATPAEVAAAVEKKLGINEKRDWPDWRLFDPSDPIEHVRTPAAPEQEGEG